MSVALISRTGETVDAIDVFAGYGGSSQGIHASGASVLAAANHNAHALGVHADNFPDTEHYRCDLVDVDAADYLDPVDLPKARFAWFSPSCTHHSQANASKIYERGLQMAMFEDDDWDEQAFVNSERSRATMSCVLRYVGQHDPEIVVVENVIEVTRWGPGQNGSTFRWWLRELDRLGYEVEPLFLNSKFFPPCPQSRDRVYIVAWHKGNTRPDLEYRPPAYCVSDACGGKHVAAVQSWRQPTKSWPLPRWGKHGQQYDYRCPDCRAVLAPVSWPAYTAIDWSDLGVAVGERAGLGMAPLAPNTLERIRRGLVKFSNGPRVLLPAPALAGLIPQRSHVLGTRIDEAMRTVTAGNGGGGQAFIVKNNGSLDEATYRGPMGTVTAHPTSSLVTHGMVLPVAGNTYERPGQVRARDFVEPLFTQHTTQAFGFAHMPQVVEVAHAGARSIRGVHEDQVTVAGHGTQALALTPGMFSKINGGPGDTSWHHLGEPLNTVTGRDTHGMVILPWVEQWRSDPIAVTEALATAMTHLRHSLASVEPNETITLADLERVRFRMLSPDPELRRAMAFGDDYRLNGNKTQMTAGLGNAVTPPVAAWITQQCLATLGGETDQ